MTDQVGKNKKIRVTGLILICLIAIVAVLLALTIISKNAPIANAPGRTMERGDKGGDLTYSVFVKEIAPESLENYLKFNGDVVAENSVTIYPDTSGKLTKLFVSLGSFVKKGQVIAEVDPSLPGQVYVASPVKTTISGTITDLPFKVGATISSTTVSIATVGDLADLQLVSYLSEKYMASVSLGQEAFISFEPFKGETFSGSVTEISPVLDRDSRTLEIKISIEGKDARIKSGMFGSIKLITETKPDVITVPNESVISSAGGTFIYVVTSDNTAEERPVETGLVIDGVSEILSGLSPGDLVVTRGQSMLQNGSSVKVANTN